MITFVYFVYFLLFYVYNKLLKERGIDVSDFLPINRQEMEERGWQQPDFVYICEMVMLIILHLALLLFVEL